jgi:roadblock/LC7 domain-containing protein
VSGLIFSSYQVQYAYASQSIYMCAANNVIFDMDSINSFSNEDFFPFPSESRC